MFDFLATRPPLFGGFFMGVKMRYFIIGIFIWMTVSVSYANCDGKILHAGRGKICMQASDIVARPALCTELNKTKYCVSLVPGNCGRLHADLNNTSYSVSDFMKPIESIYFDGTSYIDLGFVASTDLNFEIRADLDESVILRDGALLGGRRDMADQYVVWYNTLHGYSLVAPRFFEANEINVLDIQDGANTIRWENNIFTINGQEQKISYFTTPINHGYINLTLGGLAIDGGVDSRRFLGSIYYAKFWDSHGVVMDLVAATDADGITGMYDKVSGQMLYMAH